MVLSSLYPITLIGIFQTIIHVHVVILDSCPAPPDLASNLFKPEASALVVGCSSEHEISLKHRLWRISCDFGDLRIIYDENREICV